MREKDITLVLAMIVSSLLKQAGVSCLLTRSEDRFVHLDERTSKANRSAGDLLVSLHANYHSNEKTHGIETFFFSRNSFYPRATESKTDVVINDLEHKKEMESRSCAEIIQNKLVKYARAHQPVHDRGVKTGAIQVLSGTCAPAVLVEAGFLTNAQEAGFLKDNLYQTALARAIVEGILEWLKIKQKQTF